MIVHIHDRTAHPLELRVDTERAFLRTVLADPVIARKALSEGSAAAQIHPRQAGALKVLSPVAGDALHVTRRNGL